MIDILIPIFIFVSGILVQFFTMKPDLIFHPSWREWRWLLICVLIVAPLIFLFSMHRSEGDVLFSFWSTLTMIVGFVTVGYRRNLMPSVTAYDVFVVSVVAIIIMLSKVSLSYSMALILFSLFAFICINLFCDFGKLRRVRISLVLCFCVVMAYVSISYFTSHELIQLFFMTDKKPVLDFMTIFASGAVFMYAFVVAGYVLVYLVHIVMVVMNYDEIYRTQLRKYNDMIAEAYIFVDIHVKQKVVTILIFSILLVVHFFGDISLLMFTSFALALAALRRPSDDRLRRHSRD